HPKLDDGTDNFPATNLEITTIDVGNKATNVIPAQAQLSFNIRFNDRWDVEALQAEIHNRLGAAAGDDRLRQGRDEPIDFDLQWRGVPSEAFLTNDRDLINGLSASIEAVTSRKPVLSTTGGTSDARFIKNYCPVV